MFGRTNRHHHQERHHHPEHSHPESGHGHPHAHRGEREHHGGGGRFGGRGGRAKRGEARYVLLDALRDGPKHGYEIIKALEQRSSGQYAPSPGMVYPVLQFLEDLGFVRADQDAERRVYHLTETGQAELEAHADEINAFWTRLKGPTLSPTSRTEVDFLREEFDHLGQTVRDGLHSVLEKDDHTTIRRVREAVEQCRNQVRAIIAESHQEQSV